MPPTFSYEVQHVLPEIVLSAAAIVILLADPFVSKPRKWISGVVALLGLLIGCISTIQLIGANGTYFSGMIVVDHFSIFFRFTFLTISTLIVLSSFSFLSREDLNLGEYYALILFSTVGMNLMAASNELIMIFLGLETLSIACYILLGIRRKDPRSNESALKYFLLGSFSSAFLLYGIALAYGTTRTTNLESIAAAISAGTADMQIISLAIGLLFVGFGFKIATVPFHVWTPDVYQGAPTPVTAFMSAGPKAAGFAILLRVFLVALPSAYWQWFILVWISAVLTMTLGNTVALVQTNIKRMLAYSSIAHAGYILVAFATGKESGVAAALFYTVTYALMNIGAFTCVALIGREEERKLDLEDYAGIGFKQPALAACLSIFLLSLAGIPLTAGFAGKFFIFKSALESNLLWLTIIGVLNSAISVYYYLRVIVMMYMKEPSTEFQPIPLSIPTVTVLAVSSFAIFQLGLYPDFLINLAKSSVLSMR